MRIISGTAKGLRLKTPKSAFIRPVADKVKESIFSILGPLEGHRVLDLFAGTGSVGLEAISRGAESATFVDSLGESLKLLKENSQICGFENQTEIVRGRLPNVLGKLLGPYSLIFVDPPYDKGLIRPCLLGLLDHKLVDAQTRIIIEHSPRELPDVLHQTDRRKYGQTLVTFLGFE